MTFANGQPIKVSTPEEDVITECVKNIVTIFNHEIDESKSTVQYLDTLPQRYTNHFGTSRTGRYLTIS